MRTAKEIALAAIDAYADENGDIWQDAPDDVREWQKAIAAQVRLAVREAVEEACKKVCARCADGKPVDRRQDGKAYFHPGNVGCHAEDIREHFRRARYL